MMTDRSGPEKPPSHEVAENVTKLCLARVVWGMPGIKVFLEMGCEFVEGWMGLNNAPPKRPPNLPRVSP